MSSSDDDELNACGGGRVGVFFFLPKSRRLAFLSICFDCFALPFCSISFLTGVSVYTLVFPLALLDRFLGRALGIGRDVLRGYVSRNN